MDLMKELIQLGQNFNIRDLKKILGAQRLYMNQ